MLDTAQLASVLHTQPQMCYNALTKGHEEDCIDVTLLVIENFQFHCLNDVFCSFGGWRPMAKIIFK